jgi:predicted nucleic acid-binding protein
MRVLVDANVVLDLVLEREPWRTDADRFWRAVGEKHILGGIAASTVTDIFYIVRRAMSLGAAHAAVRTCLDSFEVVTVDRAILERATLLSGSDYEDNVQIACAAAARMDAIVTRDPAGFRQSALPALTPAEVVERLDQAT